MPGISRGDRSKVYVVTDRLLEDLSRGGGGACLFIFPTVVYMYYYGLTEVFTK